MAQYGNPGMYGEMPTNSATFHVTLSASGVTEASPVLVFPQHQVYMLRLPLDPVRVECDDGSETLRYREADMVEGRLYKVTWYGERYAVLKARDGVKILKFYPDEK